MLYSDGGGKVRAALLPIYGPDEIGRLFIGLRRLPSYDVPPPRFVAINGAPEVIAVYADGSVNAMNFAFEGERVKAIYTVRSPDKLAGIHL